VILRFDILLKVGYFSENYSALCYPLAEADKPGLRKAQVGAVFAIGSHFTVRDHPAIIVMPTGSGKTAVLMLAPYIRRAKRVLVITTSRLVRNQIAQDFGNLKTLKEMKVLSTDLEPPKVHELKSQITSVGDWESLRKFDVVVTTPRCVSPAIPGVPPPPDDLFDMLLVDEAHHAPAKTWRAVLGAFAKTERVLFTATPYRRDGREIRGRMIYTYPLKAAYEDKIFGQIKFVPVDVGSKENSDVAIAKAAEKVFKDDQKMKLRHCVMVRTDGKNRADQLAIIYDKHTSLKLRVVHSGLSYRTVEKTIQQLKAGQLHGVICVDMMSEGFDFPHLKIAAIHAPHKSIAVTLQFIGRFARTNASDIGEAKFVAVPAEIGGEIGRLYEQNAVWQELVLKISGEKLFVEETVREAIESFEPPQITDATTAELSLYALWPFKHVKIYHVPDYAVDISVDVTLPKPFDVVHHRVSPEHSTSVIIANEQQRPKWTDLELFNRSEYDLFVVFWDAKSKLLFINASRRSDALYEVIAKRYTLGQHKILSLHRINRVLRGIDNPDFFNVGMRNRILNSNTESYRIITGKKAHRSVQRSDGRLFHRGHIFGKGADGDKSVTIGYSSASKVWSNENTQIPELVEWCRTLAKRIVDDKPMPEVAGLEHLAIADEITELPDNVIAATWDESAFKQHIAVAYRKSNGKPVRCELTDLDLVIDHPNCDKSKVRVIVRGDDLEYLLDFSLKKTRYFELADPAHPEVTIIRGQAESSLLEYMNNNLLSFFCADFSVLHANTLLKNHDDDFTPFDAARIETIPWGTFKVDIETECWTKQKKKKKGWACIHEHMLAHVNTPEHDVIVYDHGSGEIADVVTFSKKDGKLYVRLFHCKGSGDRAPGDRVGDVYEVCGQVVKSIIWVERSDALCKAIKKRIKDGSEIIKGTEQELETLLEFGLLSGLRYQIVLVQPGITKAGLTPKIANIIAAADDYVRRGGGELIHLVTSP
jgi:superfamily II DNA or RNA helicase